MNLPCSENPLIVQGDHFEIGFEDDAFDDDSDDLYYDNRRGCRFDKPDTFVATRTLRV